MTSFDRLVEALAGWAVPDDCERQAELQAMVSRATGGGRERRTRELVGLAALGLQRRVHRPTPAGRRGGGDALREGMGAAAPVAFLMAAATAAVVRPAGVEAIALAIGAVAAGVGTRPLVVAASIAAVAMAGASGHLQVGLLVAVVVAAVCSLWGVVDRSSRGGLAALVALVGAIAAVGWAGLAVPEPVVRITSVMVVVSLLAAAWLEPRYGVIATVVMLCRFAAFDLGDLAGSFAALGSELAVDELLIRWTVMSAGLIASIAITHRSFQRAALV